jgi:hypothetical protein
LILCCWRPRISALRQTVYQASVSLAIVPDRSMVQCGF